MKRDNLNILLIYTWSFKLVAAFTAVTIAYLKLQTEVSALNIKLLITQTKTNVWKKEVQLVLLGQFCTPFVRQYD